MSIISCFHARHVQCIEADESANKKGLSCKWEGLVKVKLLVHYGGVVMERQDNGRN